MALGPANAAVPFTTSTSNLIQGDGQLLGFFVATSSSGTIKIYDSAAQSGTVMLNTTGTLAVGWYPLPANFATGISITVGGTLTGTFIYKRV